MSEKLLRLSARSVSLNYSPAGFGGLRPSDIAQATSDWPNWLYDLLRAKLSGIESERRILALQACQGLVKVHKKPYAVCEAVSAFVEPPLCSTCHGSGKVQGQKGRLVKCRPCAGSGAADIELSRAGEVVYQAIYAEAERALARFKRRLAG